MFQFVMPLYPIGLAAKVSGELFGWKTYGVRLERNYVSAYQESRLFQIATKQQHLREL